MSPETWDGDWAWDPRLLTQSFLLYSKMMAWDSNYKGPVFLDAEGLWDEWLSVSGTSGVKGWDRNCPDLYLPERRVKEHRDLSHRHGQSLYHGHALGPPERHGGISSLSESPRG